MITVQVTQDDIVHGEQRVCRQCPVALALNRALSNLLGYPVSMTVQVHSAGVFTATDKFLGRIRLPVEISKRIVKFDNSNKMEPFEFLLRDYSPINREWPSEEIKFAIFYYTGDSC